MSYEDAKNSPHDLDRALLLVALTPNYGDEVYITPKNGQWFAYKARPSDLGWVEYSFCSHTLPDGIPAQVSNEVWRAMLTGERLEGAEYAVYRAPNERDDQIREWLADPRVGDRLSFIDGDDLSRITVCVLRVMDDHVVIRYEDSDDTGATDVLSRTHWANLFYSAARWVHRSLPDDWEEMKPEQLRKLPSPNTVDWAFYFPRVGDRVVYGAIDNKATVQVQLTTARSVHYMQLGVRGQQTVSREEWRELLQTKNGSYLYRGSLISAEEKYAAEQYELHVTKDQDMNEQNDTNAAPLQEEGPVMMSVRFPDDMVDFYQRVAQDCGRTLEEVVGVALTMAVHRERRNMQAGSALATKDMSNECASADETARDNSESMGAVNTNQTSGDTGYRIKVWVIGEPGYYEYRVNTKDQAMTHFGAITTGGYRRRNDRGHLVWYAPSRIGSITIDGPGLETDYPDTFKRT